MKSKSSKLFGVLYNGEEIDSFYSKREDAEKRAKELVESGEDGSTVYEMIALVEFKTGVIGP